MTVFCPVVEPKANEKPPQERIFSCGGKNSMEVSGQFIKKDCTQYSPSALIQTSAMRDDMKEAFWK